MTFRVEVDGVVVPDSATAGTTSHEEAAARIAPLNYAGKIIAVDASVGDYLDRRWFEIVADPEGGPNTVVEVHKTAAGNVIPLRGRDD